MWWLLLILGWFNKVSPGKGSATAFSSCTEVNMPYDADDVGQGSEFEAREPLGI